LLSPTQFYSFLFFFFLKWGTTRGGLIFFFSLFRERDKERVALVYPIKKKKGNYTFLFHLLDSTKAASFFFFEILPLLFGFFRPSVRIKELILRG
jgi:hypothetical protein